MYNSKYTYAFSFHTLTLSWATSQYWSSYLRKRVFAFLWLALGQATPEPVGSLSWCSCLSIIKTALLLLNRVHLPLSWLCSIILMFLPKIDEGIAPTHHLRITFSCRDLLAQHTLSQKISQPGGYWAPSLSGNRFPSSSSCGLCYQVMNSCCNGLVG